MYFLNFGTILPTALLGMFLTLLTFALALLALRLCGFRLLWRKKGSPRRERFKVPTTVKESPAENELSEEELIVILTAAATSALGESNTSRFRVVEFRRL